MNGITMSIPNTESPHSILTQPIPICYDDGMAKTKRSDLISINFKLAPEQIRQLTLLAVFYGGRTRVFVAALDRLYQSTLRENAAFAEMAAAGVNPPAADDPAE